MSTRPVVGHRTPPRKGTYRGTQAPSLSPTYTHVIGWPALSPWAGSGGWPGTARSTWRRPCCKIAARVHGLAAGEHCGYGSIRRTHAGWCSFGVPFFYHARGGTRCGRCFCRCACCIAGRHPPNTARAWKDTAGTGSTSRDRHRHAAVCMH